VRVTMQLEGEGGRALPTFHHRGQTFVLGDTGSRYNIRLTNHSSSRVELVMSVDGRDVIHGRMSNPGQDRGYVLPAHGSAVIRGFRTSMSSVAAFRFSSPESSYAGRLGRPFATGVIRAAAFRERQPMMVRPRPLATIDRKKRSRRPGRAAGEASRSMQRPPDDLNGEHFGRRDRRSNLGTEFGEHTRSRVMQTSFERANRFQPDRRLTLHYDDIRGLESRGIAVFRERPFRMEPPRFEPHFAQPPPRRNRR
jgi:hypothetical protein